MRSEGFEKLLDVREWPWFRATAGSVWHVVELRQDLDLRAVCGYTRRWSKSEQTRATVPPGRSCETCLNRSGTERRNGTEPAADVGGRRRDD